MGGVKPRVKGGGAAAAIALILWAATGGFAASPGTSGGSILGIPTGARAIAMGEAYTAQADDVSSLYWNPSGVAFLNQSQASFVYNQFLEDLTYNNASVATPLEYGGVGGSVSYLSYGDIAGSDPAGNPTGGVSAYSAVGTLGGAVLGNNWAAGLNLKGIQETLAEDKANGIAADMGFSLLYPQSVAGGTLRSAVVLRNVGSGMKHIDQDDPFPRQWRIGVAAVQMLKKSLNLSLDYGQERDQNGAVYAGVEYWIWKYIALRTGYAGNDGEGSPLRAGVGLRLKDFSFDYAYSDYGDLGAAHRYELTWRFGTIIPRLTPEERALFRRAKIALRNERYGEATMLFDSLLQLVPNYRPAQRFVKVAMSGYENSAKDEANPLALILTPKRTSSAYEINDEREMEALLKLTEESGKKSAQASGRTQENQP